ncbi:hypothetical protein BVX94_01710 [bacterium B17]|nr:hypothetical protein BVX94_01710 [bacterium B17]
MSATAVKRKRVKFELNADEDNTVYVAGSFNDWNPKKNKLKFKDGIFATSVLLPRGRYEYKFVVNDTWCVDPDCEEWAPNEMGSLNSIKTVE